MRKYIDYVIENGSSESDEERAHPAFLVPLAISGTKTADNTAYLNESDWVWSNILLMQFFSTLTNRVTEQKHARYVLRFLSKHKLKDEHLNHLKSQCEKALIHDANIAREKTLYMSTGQTVTGTYAELEKETGLSYNQIRDLVKGRRRRFGKYYTSEKEAMIGPLKPGPKKKEVDFFESEGTHFF